MVGKSQKKRNRILGFDISENSIVALEVSLTKRGVSIVNGFQLNTPVLQDLNQTAEVVQQNLKAYNIKTKDCIFGFSMQYFKLFPVSLPTTIPQEEVSSIVLQEGNIDAEKQCAVWRILENTRRQDPDGVSRYDVLGISMDKTLVDFSGFISKKCGLKLMSVSPTFFGNGVFLDEQAHSNLIATLWVSQIKTEVVFWYGQDPIYEHLFFTHQLNDQVFQSANFIQSQLPGVQVSTIYAFGPFVKEVNLTQMPYPVQPFVFPQNFYDVGAVLQRVNINEAIPVVGLALSASNHYPYAPPNLLQSIQVHTEKASTAFKDFISAQTKGSSLKLPFMSFLQSVDPFVLKFVYASLAIIFVTICSNLFIQNILAPGVLASKSAVGNKLSLVQLQLTKVLSYEKKNTVLNTKFDFLSELIGKRKPWSNILKEIASMTPKGVWIDRMKMRKNYIYIFGRSLDVDSVANFSINLNHTAELVGKTKIIALKKFQEDSVDIIEFQLSTQVIRDKNKLANKNAKSTNSKQIVNL